MKPVQPKLDGLAEGWHYRDEGHDRIPSIQLLVRIAPMSSMTGQKYPLHVVTVWEPDDEELARLGAMLVEHRNGGPRPRVSIDAYTAGSRLQPLKVHVGDASYAYQPTAPTN